MNDLLNLVEKLRREHEGIRWHAGALDEALSDASALIQLKLAQIELTPGRPGARESWSLGFTLQTVEKGLMEHFGGEERDVLALFHQYGGEGFISAWLAEHNQILEAISRLRDRVRNKEAEEKGRPGPLPGESEIVNSIQHLRWLLTEHLRKEEQVLARAEKELRRDQG